MAKQLLQGIAIVAAVVGNADGNVAVVVKGFNQVAAAHGHGVNAGGVAHLVHQPFQQKSGLGPAGPAIGFHRRAVGEHAIHIGLDVGNVIRAGVHQAVQNSRNARRRRGQIGAHSGIHHAADGGNFAVRVGRHLHIFHMVAPVGGGDIVFGAGLRPLDRRSQLH